MAKYSNPSGLACSFCHKPQRDVDKIIAGPNVYICSECVKLCLDIIREKAEPKPISWGQNKVPPPAKFKAFLDQYVIGQEQAKRKISVAVYNHYKRLEVNQNNSDKADADVEVQKSNLLLIGPTGTGKTLIAQTLARFLDVPFVIADATTLTEAGYVGEDVENIVLNLYQAAGSNLDRTLKGIVYIDEIDKLAKKSFTSSVSRDVSGEGVQQALLKIIEGTLANIQTRGNKRLPNQEYLQIDTSNILFICGGSFEGLEKIIEQRLGRKSVGFLSGADSDEQVKEDKNGLLARVTPEDLERFGLIPEFIGRLPIIAVMNPLREQDLVQILTEPKNSLVKQYQKLFKFEKVKLTFTEDALVAIAAKAVQRKAGARGLRTIIEQLMLNIMYEIPSQDNIREVIINKEVVTDGAEPKTELIRDYGVPG
ncbi:MAG: ATP-dependent Clp protease ATP-binding subunit ClpX [Myxococcota bacterium]